MGINIEIKPQSVTEQPVKADPEKYRHSMALYSALVGSVRYFSISYISSKADVKVVHGTALECAVEITVKNPGTPAVKYLALGQVHLNLDGSIEEITLLYNSVFLNILKDPDILTTPSGANHKMYFSNKRSNKKPVHSDSKTVLDAIKYNLFSPHRFAWTRADRGQESARPTVESKATMEVSS